MSEVDVRIRDEFSEGKHWKENGDQIQRAPVVEMARGSMPICEKTAGCGESLAYGKKIDRPF